MGGGLYWHVLERLLELATDPAPRVSTAAQKALLATGLDPTHPLLRPVVLSAEVLAGAAAGAAGGAWGGKGGTGPGRATGGGGGGVGGGGCGDGGGGSSGLEGFGSPVPAGREGEASVTPLGRHQRTASWSQKLSNAASRILGSPRPGQGGGGSIFSPGPGGGGGGEMDSPGGDGLGTMSGLQRSTSALRLMSPLSKMKRTNTANVPLRALGSLHGSEHPSFPPPFASGTEAESPRAADVSGGGGGGGRRGGVLDNSGASGGAQASAEHSHSPLPRFLILALDP